MTKRQNVTKTLLVAVVLLTLISACFLGSTLARYTTGGEGTASVTVANWKITDSHTGGSGNVSFGDLTPSMAVYDSSKVRSHTTGVKEVINIKNESEVSAVVTVTLGDAVFAKLTGAEDITEAEKALITIKWYSDENGTDFDSSKSVTLDKGESLTVYAEVIWESADSASVNGDALDTSLGQKLESVSWSVSWIAVQGEQKP